MAARSKANVRRPLEILNHELHQADLRGEVFLVGGAVMCLAYGARASTRDVDALFRPPEKVREPATRTSIKAGIGADWLNDAVKGFISPQGEFAPFFELDHLRVMTAKPEYLLAMKGQAMRIGAEFHDEEDVRFLLRLLDVRSYEHARRIIAKYYPLARFPQKTPHALAATILGLDRRGPAQSWAIGPDDVSGIRARRTRLRPSDHCSARPTWRPHLRRGNSTSHDPDLKGSRRRSVANGCWRLPSGALHPRGRLCWEMYYRRVAEGSLRKNAKDEGAHP